MLLNFHRLDRDGAGLVSSYLAVQGDFKGIDHVAAPRTSMKAESFFCERLLTWGRLTKRNIKYAKAR